MIEAVHLCKRYGAQTAVEDIHFSVSPGEIVGLIGHNGSGKTTTMRMLTGCLEPTSGDVLIDGQSLLRHAELKKQIGYLPEIPPLYPEMTVNEQMCFAAGLRGLTGKAAKDAITTALRQLHVEEVRGRLIRNLSKGYRQRVGIAAALLGSPKVIILDEPTAGQDFRHYTDIMEFLRGLNEQGVTVVMITHDMHLMLEYTPRALVFCDGQLIADRSAAAVLCDPELIEQAALKETSLFTLANRCGIAPAEDFVERFIHEDREVRTHGC